jgi:hypothetical protein
MLPPTYEGPPAWASRLRYLEASEEQLPHWFVRPLALARIRAAYQAAGGQHPFVAMVEHLAESLSARLGDAYLVQTAYLDSTPLLRRQLAALAKAGIATVILVPIGDEALSQQALRGQVALSRVREVGITVRYAMPLEYSLWPLPSPDEELLALLAGRPLTIPPSPGDDIPDALHERVLAAH